MLSFLGGLKHNYSVWPPSQACELWGHDLQVGRQEEQSLYNPLSRRSAGQTNLTPGIFVKPRRQGTQDVTAENFLKLHKMSSHVDDQALQRLRARL